MMISYGSQHGDWDDFKKNSILSDSLPQNNNQTLWIKKIKR